MNFWQIVLFLLGIAITIRYSGIAQTSSGVPGAPTPNAANAKPSLNQWILTGVPSIMGNPVHPTTAMVNQVAVDPSLLSGGTAPLSSVDQQIATIGSY